MIMFSEKIYKKKIHTFLNINFLLFVLPIQFLLSIGALFVSNYTQNIHQGILFLLSIPTNSLMYYVVGFFILDFFDYLYHNMMHKIPFFWKFHQIHHSDLQVDTSTTIREHPGETFIRVTYLIIIIYIIGASPWLLIIRQIFQSVSNIASHSKILMPKKINNLISIFFVTPNTHHIHHHYKLPNTDSNFGDVFSIWDRIFNTFSKMNHNDIIYGVDSYFDKEENNNFKKLIRKPFNKTRL